MFESTDAELQIKWLLMQEPLKDNGKQKDY